MHISINTASQFRDLFKFRQDQFSYEALGLLFDYFDECAPDIECDVIAICCDYTEDTPENIADSYSIDIDGMDEDETKEAVRDFLDNHTSIVGETSSGDFVYANF